MNRLSLRNVALFGGPLGYIALGLVHPVPDPDVGEATGFFVFLHLVQPVLIGLLAYALWTLAGDLPGRAAKIVRIMVLPYAIADAIFDTIAGISMGLLIGEVNELSGAERAGGVAVVEGLRDLWIGYPIYLAASLSWLVAVVALAVALRQVAPLRVSLLVGIGGAIFAVAHPLPFGPVGMTLFLAGVALYELRYARAAERIEGLPALQA